MMVLLIPCKLCAVTPSIETLQAKPYEIIVHESTQVTISARIAGDPRRVPSKVRLLRLQWAGNEREVSRMWDDGTHGDRVKNDGLYTCKLKLKEPVTGVVSFRVEAFYPDRPEPVRSQPIFITVVGGLR